MKSNEVLENIYSRRSIRSYEDKKVPKELIEELLNAAVMAPSSRGSQPWNFTIVENKELIKKLDEALKKEELLQQQIQEAEQSMRQTLKQHQEEIRVKVRIG